MYEKGLTRGDFKGEMYVSGSVWYYQALWLKINKNDDGYLYFGDFGMINVEL